MNPLTNVKNIKKLSETELRYNLTGKASWHYQYKDSAWIFIGGLPYELTEGDVICIFSQYGEVVNINLVRDKATGKSKGFCFLCYEDQRSTILAVDNLNSIKVCGRIIRVDHVEQYKIPKDPDKLDENALRILQEGCGPESSVINTLKGKSSHDLKKDSKKEGNETENTQSKHQHKNLSDQLQERLPENMHTDRQKRHNDLYHNMLKSSSGRERGFLNDQRYEKSEKSPKRHEERDNRKDEHRTFSDKRRQEDRSNRRDTTRHDQRSMRDRSRSRDRERRHRL